MSSKMYSIKRSILRKFPRIFMVTLWITAVAVCLAVFCRTGSYTRVVDRMDDYHGCISLFASLTFSCFTLLYFLIQALLAVCYRPAKTLPDGELPPLTVIIPAYNEGRQIYKAIESATRADYPAGKLEIMAINDGSVDDTWQWIQKAAADFPGRVQAIDVPENRGKKHALCLGIRQASGEVIVTIDSDSAIEPDALRKIASPFADPKVGAVAGNIRVMNLNAGAIPKMLDTAFAFGFEFMRAAQSVIHSVLCTPGALSAYRLSAVKPLVPHWEKQTFLGKPATIGEDRAITSMLIRSNWHVDFQSNAFAYTNMPTTYRGLCRMLTRWCRSDIRENIIMLNFAFFNLRHFRFRQLGLQLNVLFASVSIILPLFSIPALLLAIISVPFEACLLLAAGNVLWSTVPAFIYASRYGIRNAHWALVYGFYYLPFLSWIGVYSVLTLRNTSWITRQLPFDDKKKSR